MRLFLDANILFTAAYSPEGSSRALFNLAEAGCCALWSSRLACEEARRNIALKAPDRLADLQQLLSVLSMAREPLPHHLAIAERYALPRKDIPILAAAIACAAEVLVTGDRRDFDPLMGRGVEGCTVLSPRESLRWLLDRIQEDEKKGDN